ncbi:MAG: aminodeoxychorismate lyase [Gammaproteobacteria bacterium]|nr:aminodeoxychorismate lyase [Gammaproteobacteria bacterium]
MILINGETNDKVSARDRGLAYGDGVFETLAVVNNKIHNWDLHVNRLHDSLKRLKFPTIDEQLLLSRLNELIEHSEFAIDNRFIIKLIITRGETQRGYQLPIKTVVSEVLFDSKWPDFANEYYINGIDIQELSINLPNQPVLAGIKHLNRLEQVMAQAELDDVFQEGFLCNSDRQLISAISGNLFVVYKDVLHVLNQQQSGISGTIRQQIINHFKGLKRPVCNDLLDTEKLFYCSEVFLSNSIRGLWPVKSIQFKSGKIKKYKIGKVYRMLSALINKELGYTNSL